MDDLISRSALKTKAIVVTEYDEGGWGIDLLAVPLCDVETAPAVDDVEAFQHLDLMQEAFDMAKSTLAPVVRCKDCEHGHPSNAWEEFWYCEVWTIHHRGDNFCSYGERRADDEENTMHENPKRVLCRDGQRRASMGWL